VILGYVNAKILGIAPLNRVIHKKVCESLKTRLLCVDWCVKQMIDKQVNVINLGKGLWEL